MWDIFVGFFTNIFNLVMMLIFVLVGVLIGLLFKPSFANRVIKLIPRDRRFVEFDIEQENACSVECKPKKGYPLQRFFKYAPGFTGRIGKVLKRPTTIFLGKEGTAYTFATKSEKVKMGLAQAVQNVWGQDFYDEVPEAQRAKLEESKVSVTVDLGEGLTPEDYSPVTEEDIKSEEDRKAATTFWEGKSIVDKKAWIEYLFIAGFGFGVALALQILGILRI